MRILGDPFFGDLLEQVTYNALPATFSPDMWAHQYDQQVNQVLATVARRKLDRQFRRFQHFGLEPHFGCCTANMHQAFPKFSKSLFMATPGGGLAATAYAPCQAYHCRRRHPRYHYRNYGLSFKGKIQFDFVLDAPCEFDFQPANSGLGGSSATDITGETREIRAAGNFHVMQREWQSGDSVTLNLPMDPRLSEGHRGLLRCIAVPCSLACVSMKSGNRLPASSHMRLGNLSQVGLEFRPHTCHDDTILADLAIEEAAPSETPFSTDAPPVTIKGSSEATAAMDAAGQFGRRY